MRAFLLLCILCLGCGGCTTIPTEAQHDLIGVSRSDLVACAGVPDQDETRDNQEVLVWKIEKSGSGSFSISAPFDISMTINTNGACHVIASVRDGKVARVAYTGPSSTWQGKDAACAPVLRACVASAVK
ncbi:hypothetical protein EDC15_10769 [Acetobacter aceti NBRC 14818]|uniref:Uncharacterized protein n=2 Tax=Acetobacter aceti TaxID=435 RepID=A0A6S6PT13_ACEAC|nr:hypothetical protein [Acetobacter aceti]TCS33387.1 hypothetical protein EDC15_10769 [Acetobacter aceti NBRC 14818]BCI67862.1 hypothetical protein AAJCM20276_24860 [Acetobacter aceti]BCK77554.1 hypothetical protein EMQ_3160 [Acetobacter aceti NBRC 14818]GAN56807.1 hypothetical protein Abac_010_081 [Acetobacter aceti NBRC 14818]